MAGINLQGGFGAGGAVDALRVLIAENFRKQQEQDQVVAEQARMTEAAARRDEDARQANQRNAVDLAHLGVSQRYATVQEKDLADKEAAAQAAAMQRAAQDAAFEQSVATLDPTQQAFARANRASPHNVLDLSAIRPPTPPRPISTSFSSGGKNYVALQDEAGNIVPGSQRNAPIPSNQQEPPPSGSVLQEVTAVKPDPATANTPDRTTGLTPNAVYQSGIAYALQGTLPAMGMGSNPNVRGARSAIINKGSALAAAAGVDLPTLRADYRANAGALAKLVPIYTATDAASETADRNLKLALDQSTRTPRTQSPMVNRFVQWASGHELTGNPDLTRLEVYIYTAAREYAKVTQGSSASVVGLTDTAAREANKLLNAAQSPEAFQAAIGAMRDDMQNVKASYLNRINQTSSTIANFLSAVTYTPFEASKREETSAGGAGATGIKDGTQQPIPGIPGGIAEYRGGKWIRIK